MKNLIQQLTKGAQAVDGFVESPQERQQTLSSRHERDMNSDNFLSKSIRPLTLLVLLSLQIVMVVLSALGYHVNETLIMQHGILLSGAFGFYFSSRKAEKVAAQNAKANIELQKMKTNHQIKTQQKQEKINRRTQRKEQRRSERQQEKDN